MRCKICGASYRPFGTQKYCSEPCETIAKHMLEKYVCPSKTNTDDLTDAQYKKLIWIAKCQQDASDLRITMLKEKCEVCTSTEKLVVHHISYNPVEVVTLCRRCHGLLHMKYLKRKRVHPIRNHRQ